MKKIILLLLSVLLTACTPSSTTNKNFINTKGTTLETRIPTPKGYTREQSDFAHFLQTYPLKEMVVLFFCITVKRSGIKVHKLRYLSYR